MFYAGHVTAQCPRCLELEDELRVLEQRLAATGQHVAFSPGPNPNADVEHELKRWLAVSPRGDASSFRAGWARLARHVSPKLREWETRWRSAMRENEHLRSRIGTLIMEISRRDDSG